MSTPRLGADYDPGRNYPNGQLTDPGNRLDARDIAGYTLTPAGARASFAVSYLMGQGMPRQGAAALMGGFAKEDPNLNPDQLQARSMDWRAALRVGDLVVRIDGKTRFGISRLRNSA
jgi:hypothetical protein